MSGSNVTVPSVKGLSTLVRPKFAPGMLLQHEDLDSLSAYTRELNRLMFRSLFGCGVVCGLVVKPDPTCGQGAVTIDAGLGLDCDGDPIYVPKQQRLVLDKDCVPNTNGVLWIVLCAKVKCCAPRTPMCPADDDEQEAMCTRERYAFEIRAVAEPPKCACSCVQEEDPAGNDNDRVVDEEEPCWCADPKDPCHHRHYQGECGCECDDCSGGTCCCDCILLARIEREGDVNEGKWRVDHSVRRFIRPVLMRDPQVYRETHQPPVAAQNQDHPADAPIGTATTSKTAAKSTKSTKPVK